MSDEMNDEMTEAPMDAVQEFSYELKVARERLPVLIGTKGETKKEIEELTSSYLDIDSKEGIVQVTGKDALKLYTAREIIKAIARGFNPDVAKLLMKSDHIFEIVNIMDYIANKNQLERLRGRIIGKEGKARKVMEDLTDAHICVYGKTIGIIGLPECVAMARKAIESLLSGSPHSGVYRWLEKRRRDVKRMSFESKLAMRNLQEK